MNPSQLTKSVTLALCASVALCSQLNVRAAERAADRAMTESPASVTPRPPSDPHATINDWLAHVIDARSNPDVATAHAVFTTLLRTWDSARIAPTLYVVESSAGPWAASLADGNILLSASAITACRSFGEARFAHLLAFVLAHELAHQRANDLWHQRFFRLADRESGPRRARLLDGIGDTRDAIDNLQAREARADHDGLLIMSSVGFDPFVVIEPTDFFTAWVENLWQTACDTGDPELRTTCAAASARALRTRTQLQSAASQASLFELGVQAYVADDMDRARRLFRAFGREHPGRLANTALGIIDLSEARRIGDSLPRGERPGFEFPILLDHQARTPAGPTTRSARRGVDLRTAAADRLDLLDRAIEHFEKAIRLAPAHPDAYLMLASAYVLSGNAPMASGVLLGQYQRRFGTDPAVELLQAMALANDGDPNGAANRLAGMMQRFEAGDLQTGSAIDNELLVYTLYQNAALLADFGAGDAQATAIWRRLARAARGRGSATLFRLALARLQVGAEPTEAPGRFPELQLARIGSTIPSSTTGDAERSELWLDGQAYRLARFADGRRVLTDSRNTVRNAWQSGGRARLFKGLEIGDDAVRPFNTLGPPDRHLFMPNGQYLSYDRLGIAIHLVAGRVNGWMLFDPD